MEEKTRAFIAVELEPEIKSIIHAFESKVIPKSPSGLRWVKTDLIHITLKFLGDITPRQVEQISQVISQVATENHPFTLTIAGTGAFPNWRNPRTLWVGLNKCDALSRLFHILDAEIAKLGFSPEGKPFSPHITLCRVSDNVDPRLVHPIQKEFEAFPTVSMPDWNINEVVFFKSQLKPGGPIYMPISKHKLI